MNYTITLNEFEGPLDLLLELTEKQKLDITRISLAKIADEYLEYIKTKECATLEHMADFLNIAAKLILIKSKSLLPLLELEEEEEEEIKDLEYQLREYKKFKDIADEFDFIFHNGKRSFSREGFLNLQPIFYPPAGCTGEVLYKHLQFVLLDVPVIEQLDQKRMHDIITLEQKIIDLKKSIKIRLEMTFGEITKKAKNRLDIVISFLAVLELIKQRIVHAEQESLFDEIKVKSQIQ